MLNTTTDKLVIVERRASVRYTPNGKSETVAALPSGYYKLVTSGGYRDDSSILSLSFFLQMEKIREYVYMCKNCNYALKGGSLEVYALCTFFLSKHAYKKRNRRRG